MSKAGNEAQVMQCRGSVRHEYNMDFGQHDEDVNYLAMQQFSESK
ncbi:MAG: hypothetical protein RHS_0606 [Robinsoniella sp. RHS]|nr:MAG: hypothetical protein RHS_0606 [Robinsoniella sp. RHS]